MNAFFLRTDDSSAGPFTGVELREAALSGIIDANSRVGGQPGGPWITASNAGLFSEKMVPLPHPPGVHIPRYQVQGMPGAFQGPFKLRELIGFAARGMLPTDAQLQSDLAPDWISVNRIPILTATLSGQLVLVEADGTLHRRAVVSETSSRVRNTTTTKPADPPQPRQHGAVNSTDNSGRPAKRTASAESKHAAVFEPQAITHSADASDATTRSSGRWLEDEPADSHPHRSANLDQQSTIGGDQDTVSDHLVMSLVRRIQSWVKSRQHQNAARTEASSFGKRLALVATVLLFVLGSGVAYFRWQATGMQPTAIVGDWTSVDESVSGESGPAIGISFRSDGTCVLFNPDGESWSGDYEWIERSVPTAMTSLNLSSIITEIDAAHQPADVLPTDGYLRLNAVGGSLARLGTVQVGDLFVRRNKQQLMIGYPASIDWASGERIMRAGWISLSPSAEAQLDRSPDGHTKESMKSADDSVALALAELMPDPSRDSDVSLAAIDIAAAIRELVKRGPSAGSDVQDNAIETYSNVVDGDYLLRHFGVPDEARGLFGFEKERFPDRSGSDATQLIRYGLLRLVLSDDGRVRFASFN